MFRRRPTPVGNILGGIVKDSGLVAPLMEKRLLDAWDSLTQMQPYTQDRFIKNQTLFVKISSPAMRAELSMMKSQLVQQLNSQVGAFVISDIRIY